MPQATSASPAGATFSGPRGRAAVLARHLAAAGLQSAPDKLSAISVASDAGGEGWEAAARWAEAIYAELHPPEWVGLMRGKGAWSNHGVERLKIPPFWMTDGPSGARGPVPGIRSASTPCGAALGASWDPELCREVGALLGRETKVKGAQVLLGPTVNLHRQPLGGRHFECFSEDPQLTAGIAVGWIKGVQGEGVACCVKHYCCNDQEHRRDYISAEVSEKALREVYLPPFEAAVKEGDCMTIMTGYNRVNGTFCSENRHLLQDVLRREWGFQGCVISDWTGTHSTWGNLEAGMDIEMPEMPGMWYGHRLARLFHGDLEGLRRLTKPRVLSVLRVMARLGLLPAPGAKAPRVIPNPPGHSPNEEGMRSVLRRAAAESIVLLKNGAPGKAAPLPLSGGTLRAGAVAVLGPTAMRLTTQGGGSASVLENSGSYDLVAALRRRAGEAAVVHSMGTDAMTRFLSPPRSSQMKAPGGKGFLDVEFLAGSSWEEWPGDRAPTAKGSPVTVLDNGFFTGIFYNQDPPSRKFQVKGPWCARYRGLLTPERSGRHEFSLAGTGDFRLHVGGREVLRFTGTGESLEMGGFLGDLGTEGRVDVELQGGKTVEVLIEWRPGALRPSRLHLGFREKPWANEAELIEVAKATAAKADVAIVVLGTVVNGESEGRDQDAYDQRGVALAEAVAAVNPRTVLCLNVGSPKGLPPQLVERVAGLAVTWLGGQEAAEGLAAALYGEGWGPCGRLPTTWPVRLEDGPTRGRSGLQYPGSGTQVAYDEGVLVGHRWFESQGIAPLFHFGHGLTYTRFEHGTLEGLEGRSAKPFAAGETVEVRVPVRNAGERRGKEVVQLFALRRPGSPAAGGASGPWRLLLGFAKLSLEPGERQVATIRFPAAKAASYWNEAAQAWAIDESPTDIIVASSGAECGRSSLRVAAAAA